MSAELTLADRCRAIELLVLDVDAVLTDGGIAYAAAEGSPALEWKQFFVRDGLALAVWRKAGKRAAILSGRTSPVVGLRAEEVGIVAVIQGVSDKVAAMEKLLTQFGLRSEQVAFVGDDIIDVPALKRCGLAVAPADACSEARMAAHLVCRQGGGRGAVREAVERIMRCQGLWPLG